MKNWKKMVLLRKEVVAGVSSAHLIEDYPDAAHGPCVLVLQHDIGERPIHVLWGIPKAHTGPAVIVTAYRPDPQRWSDDYLKRKSR